LCNDFSPVLSWSPDLVLISVSVSVGAARFRFTRSLLLVVVPRWTGFELFLSSHREQAWTDGEEPELPSSVSAAVPFAGQVPFALCFEEAGSCFCSLWAQVFIFAAP
jgi:hypothetical protein